MANPTRYPSGVTSVAANHPMANMGTLYPGKFHIYHEDFDYFTAADWTITTTEAGAGSATEALTNVDGGCLLITNDDADNDADFFNKVGESFLFASNKKLYFEARFKVSDATQSDVLMGLQITDTTPLDVSDGVFFLKDDGDTNVDFYVEKNGTQTSSSAVTTMSDDTFIKLAYYYDGDSEIKVFADDTHLTTVATTNIPDDEEMTISFGIQNGEAAAKTMTIDYITCIKER